MKRRLGQLEDLRSVAALELGDATRWVELAELNDLRLPFIVKSWREQDRLPHTLIWGDALELPDQYPRPAAQITVMGADIALMQGDLLADNGDLQCVADVACLSQSLHHRLRTLRGELIYHARYGSSLPLALGLPGGPFREVAAAGWTHETLQAEPRVGSVDAVDAKMDGDALRVSARVTLAGSNASTDLNLVLNT